MHQDEHPSSRSDTSRSHVQAKRRSRLRLKRLLDEMFLEATRDDTPTGIDRPGNREFRRILGSRAARTPPDARAGAHSTEDTSIPGLLVGGVLICALDDDLNRRLARALAEILPDCVVGILLIPPSRSGANRSRTFIGRLCRAVERRTLGIRCLQRLLGLLPPHSGAADKVATYVQQNLPRPPGPSNRGAPPIVRLGDEEVRTWLSTLLPDVVVALGSGQDGTRGALREGPAVLTYHPVPIPDGRPGDPAALSVYRGRPDRLGATVTVRTPGRDERIVRTAPIVGDPALSLEEAEGAVHVAGMQELIDATRETIGGSRLVTRGPAGVHTLTGGDERYIRTCARIQIEAARRPWPGLHTVLERIPSKPASSPRVRGFPPGVYVFCYHSIVDPDRRAAWESCYRDVATHVGTFDRHLRFLSRHMRPLSLEDAPRVLANGPADRPYFVITFDDGYENLLRNAAPVCRRHRVRPTVFVNAAFAAQEEVHHRVLLSLLDGQGHGADTSAVFNEVFRTGDFAEENLLRLSKQRYRYGRTEEAAREAWKRVHGTAGAPRAHLSFEELTRLRSAGWTVGNHTRTHPSLSRVDDHALPGEIEGNRLALRDGGLDPVPWLAYPNGRSVDVDPRIARWIESTPDEMGLFAAGGVNVFPSRSEWMRMPIGDIDLREFVRTIRRNLAATLETCRRLYPYPGPSTARARPQPPE